MQAGKTVLGVSMEESHLPMQSTGGPGGKVTATTTRGRMARDTSG